MMQYLNFGISFLIGCLQLPYIVCIEGKDNKGKHFIFGFMYNMGNPVQEVFITTDCSCTVNVNVSTPLFDPNFFQTLRLSRHHVSKVTFSSRIQGGPGTLLSNKGIDIKSDEEITVYGVNRAQATADAYTVFPLDTLGDDYYVITWANTAEFMIIATAENTVVKIVIANGTNVVYNSITYTAGMILNITLNMYQTFHVYGGPDYTGTRILSNKPITVISGASCTTIGVGGCDHLSSQMTPVETFGSTFVTFKMANCNTPVHFKIVASENKTDINITGEATVTLSKPGDRYIFQISDSSSKIVTSNKPIAIAFFSEGGCGQPTGDPAMLLLQPTQQFAADYTFTTIDNPINQFKDALTIVVPESKREGLILDGSNFTAIWRKIDGSDDLRITDINITKGAHSIYHVNPIVTFLAVSTGLASTNGYAYSSGQRLAPINSNCTPTITVPGDIIDNDCDSLIDEELQDGKDNDGDGKIDEDLAMYLEEIESTTSELSTKELPTTEFSTTELPSTESPITEFSTISVTTTSTRHFSKSTFIKTFESTTASRQTITTRKLTSTSRQPTTTSRQSTTTLPTTSDMQLPNFSEEVLNTDLVIAAVVISMFALCCFITSMFFFKWRRNLISKGESYHVSQ